MPARWQTNFVNSGQDYLSADTIRIYMVQQEMSINVHCKKIQESNKNVQWWTSKKIKIMGIPNIKFQYYPISEETN